MMISIKNLSSNELKMHWMKIDLLYLKPITLFLGYRESIRSKLGSFVFVIVLGSDGCVRHFKGVNFSDGLWDYAIYIFLKHPSECDRFRFPSIG